MKFKIKTSTTYYDLDNETESRKVENMKSIGLRFVFFNGLEKLVMIEGNQFLDINSMEYLQKIVHTVGEVIIYPPTREDSSFVLCIFDEYM